MSSVNNFYTFNYSQPEEYHFSHDSIFLARKAFELTKSEDLSKFTGLDLCSGCGVVGLDYLFHLNQSGFKLPREFNFLEIQDIYQQHFNINKEKLNHISTALIYLKINYELLLSSDFKNRYDLILCNPPYFQVQQGKLSPSEFKNRCRFFMDSNFENLVLAIIHSLKPMKTAYVLIRNLNNHKIDYLRIIDQQIGHDSQVNIICQVRGTDLVSIRKN